jgi:hypothetical protein
MRTYVGDSAGAALLAGELLASHPNPGQLDARVEKLERRPAVAAIASEAATHAVVVLNENHALGQNRAFATALLEALAKEGFRYFAAEGFTPAIARSADAGVPFAVDANVMPDPLYADLVRTALRLGLVLVPYDDTPDFQTDDALERFNFRDDAEAKNLLARTIGTDPGARVFVYCGFNHAGKRGMEVGPGEVLRPMALRLAELSGTDVLTVDQTTMVSTGFERAMQPAYRFARTRPWLDQPLLLRDGAGWLRRGFGEETDLQVVLPPVKLVRGRPDWLFGVDHRQPVEIPVRFRPKHGRLLIRAFLAAEPAPGVPLDQVLLTPADTTTALALRPGSYRLVSQDEGGNDVELGPLTVEAR